MLHKPRLHISEVQAPKTDDATGGYKLVIMTRHLAYSHSMLCQKLGYLKAAHLLSKVPVLYN